MKPQVGRLYLVHWIDIESKGDWNEPPESETAPVLIQPLYLKRPWDRRRLEQVFATTLDPKTKELHDTVVIPTGAVMECERIQTVAVDYKDKRYTP